MILDLPLCLILMRRFKELLFIMLDISLFALLCLLSPLKAPLSHYPDCFLLMSLEDHAGVVCDKHIIEDNYIYLIFIGLRIWSWGFPMRNIGALR